MELMEEVEVKDTSRGYLPPHRALVIAHTSPDTLLEILGFVIVICN
jgi:hypothetical protein